MSELPARPGVHLVTDLQQVKALADPLRQRLLAAFVDEPRTTKQAAIRINEPPTKLYHHVDLLEKVGLIRLVRTQPKRGTVEKYFQAIACKFMVGAASLGHEGEEAMDEAISAAFNEALANVRPGGAGTDARGMLAMGFASLHPEELDEFRDRVLGVISEMKRTKSDRKRSTYRFLLAVYPRVESNEDSSSEP